MSIITAIRLVRSLSGSEKRLFKLHTRKQSGNKDYLLLFNFIEKHGQLTATEIVKKLSADAEKIAVDNTARYLVKLLTDVLIEIKIEKDKWFGMMHGIMRAKILQERSLTEESNKQLNKIRYAAQRAQQDIIEYLTYREELDHQIKLNFQNLDDKDLIALQMKAKLNIKNLNSLHDHHSLFELLKFRFIHSPKILSHESRKELNDLVLSEIALVSAKPKTSYAASKLHLLFQAFYFTNIGDYKSALKAFYSLNKLFEENRVLADNPPADYLSALDGILDILYTLKMYDELHFYITKTEQLDQPVYPEYFRYQVRKTVAVNRLKLFVQQQYYHEGVTYLLSLGKGWINNYAMVDEEKQCQLYFYAGICFWGIKDWKKAHEYVDEVIKNHRINKNLLICKAIRLLNMIVYYEKKDNDYLKYEVRSYKRFFGGTEQLLEVELLLLRFLGSPEIGKKRKLTALQQYKFRNEILQINNDPYSTQLLKYFDFTLWLNNKIGG